MAKYSVAPRDWHFTAADREQYADRFWTCPTRVVTDGLWAQVWRESETCRGGGGVSSMLPVLALHTWPGKQYLGGAPEDTAPGWTTYTHLSYRRIARLSGITPESVGNAFARAEALELLQRRRVPPPEHYGGPERQEYRLAAALYPHGEGDRWAKLPANLFYGALWAMLPASSARHLYVALACLDPVLDERSMLAKLQADGLDDPLGDALYSLAKIRARHPLSIRDMVQASGMSGSTVEQALGVLRTPLFWRASGEDKAKRKPDLAMVDSCEAERTGMRCYFPARAPAESWFWSPDAVNNREEMERLREGHWTEIAEQRQRRATERQNRRWQADAERLKLERERRRAEQEAEAARRSEASKAAWARRRATDANGRVAS